MSKILIEEELKINDVPLALVRLYDTSALEIRWTHQARERWTWDEIERMEEQLLRRMEQKAREEGVEVAPWIATLGKDGVTLEKAE